jgi:hypothetical protein
LRAVIPEAPVVHSDDTGWRVGGKPAHLMAFETDTATVQQIRPRHRPVHCRVLERRSVVDEEGFQGLAEVLDEMEAIDHLYGLGRAPANAVGVEVAPFATDHGDRRILGQTDRNAGVGGR